ncbi:HD domain-containing protein [Megamonas hypermegale]|uniref:HD domain-containing protein n=1 Tax=Megamonas hypermegale TaxID=158847 RepID=UPI0026EA5CA4|nr:HD domain-containing protein [Megamonas hypermegale]
MDEKDFAEKIAFLGGRVYIVGGWVRDILRSCPPKDKDYVICQLKEDIFRENFPQATRVGKSFPVYLLEIDGRKCEVAFARREKKAGHGYKGFTTFCDENITLEEDLYRRDTTMNAIAYDVLSQKIIDPYNGRGDIRKKQIKAVSHHFADDPVRALRAARQASEFNFTVTDDTLALMQSCKDEFAYEPQERIFRELKRALATDFPSVFFRTLQQAELLETLFPEIFALIGKTQPEYFHPEGDAFEHTMEIVDLVAGMTDDLAVRFAGLVHDIGKGATPPEMLPHHYGHEKIGGEILLKWNERMTLPKKWMQGGLFVIKEHMRAGRLAKVPKIVDLLLAIEKNPLGFDGFNCVILADSKGLPYYLADYKSYLAKLHSVSVKDYPLDIQGKKIGEWIRQERIKIFSEH